MQIKDICTIVPTISIGYDRKIKYMYTHYEWAITKRGHAAWFPPFIDGAGLIRP